MPSIRIFDSTRILPYDVLYDGAIDDFLCCKNLKPGAFTVSTKKHWWQEGVEHYEEVVYLKSNAKPRGINLQQDAKLRGYSKEDCDRLKGYVTHFRDGKRSLYFYRNELESTVIDNVLKYGVGALRYGDRDRTNIIYRGSKPLSVPFESSTYEEYDNPYIEGLKVVEQYPEKDTKIPLDVWVWVMDRILPNNGHFVTGSIDVALAAMLFTKYDVDLCVSRTEFASSVLKAWGEMKKCSHEISIV